jgi:putative transposase
MQVTRQAIYRTPRPRRAPQRQPAKGPVDGAIVELARQNPTDGTRMAAALASRELARQVSRKEFLARHLGETGDAGGASA